MRWYATAVLIGLGAMALLVGGCSDEDCTTPPPEPTAAAFVGSETCGNCHNDPATGLIYDQWKESGHPYKIVKIEGEAPTASFPDFSAYPSDPNAIDPPQGETWETVTYTIGGYRWKMRWIDADGWIVTSGLAALDAQYNFETDADHPAGWTTYHTDKERGEKSYDCGRCHTTGWVANPDPEDLTGNQDGLAGIHGTFFAGGIHCEECHGKGSLHAGNPTQFGMVVDDSAALCGRCHTRDALNRIEASSGFIRHHEQYDEWRHSPHGLAGGPGCNDCHDPHASVVYDVVAEGTGVTAACTDCHDATDYALNGNDPPHPSFVNIECIDCHMPKVAKSARASDSNPKYVGDVASHIFAINSDAVNMEEGMGILADGKSFIKTDEQTGLAKVTLDFVCYRCHTDESGDGGGGTVKSLGQLSTMANGIHPGSTKSQRVASR